MVFEKKKNTLQKRRKKCPQKKQKAEGTEEARFLCGYGPHPKNPDARQSVRKKIVLGTRRKKEGGMGRE